MFGYRREGKNFIPVHRTCCVNDQEAGSDTKVEKPEHPASSASLGSGPSIPQALVWGFFAAAIGSLLRGLAVCSANRLPCRSSEDD